MEEGAANFGLRCHSWAEAQAGANWAEGICPHVVQRPGIHLSPCV